MTKAWRLGAIIAQLQRDNSILETLVHPATPLEKIAEQKSAIAYLETQLDEMEQEAKKMTDATTYFWESVVQDEQLAQLTKQLQEEEG